MRNFVVHLGLVVSLSVFLSLPVSAKTNLVYCSEGSPESFNPQRTLSGTARNATAATIYDRLVDFEQGGTALESSLAESWAISDDKTTYTFNLRKGVKFQTTEYFTPTRDFNADDVLFSFNRQLREDHPYHFVGGGNYQYFQGMGMQKLIKQVSKINDYQVKIILNQPEAPFLSDLAMPFMSILSAEYGEQLTKKNKKDDIDTLPVGTGPFLFKRYLKDSTIRYQAHVDYWRGKSRIDNLNFAITPDASVRYMKLKKGECDIIIYPSPADLTDIKKQPGITLAEEKGLNIGYLAMNTEKAPFNNPLVRQAIAYALNKEAYIKAIYLGNADVAINPYPPAMWSYNKDVSVYEYNPEKAKALLKQAGLEKGFSTSIWTLPVSRPYNPNGRKMGEMMQQDLAKVGIKVELLSFDWGTYLEKVKNGEHSMVQLGWAGDNGDPDNFLYTLFSCDSVKRGSNNSRYCQKDFDQLIQQARVESDFQVRKKLYFEALDILSKDSPIIPIAHSKVYRAVNNKVVGYVMSPFDVDNFYHLSITQ